MLEGNQTRIPNLRGNKEKKRNRIFKQFHNSRKKRRHFDIIPVNLVTIYSTNEYLNEIVSTKFQLVGKTYEIAHQKSIWPYVLYAGTRFVTQQWKKNKFARFEKTSGLSAKKKQQQKCSYKKLIN